MFSHASPVSAAIAAAIVALTAGYADLSRRLGSVPATDGHAPATPPPRAGGTVVARGDAGGGPVSLPRREETAMTRTHPAGHHGRAPRRERHPDAPPPLLAAALRAAATGWAVFPVRPRGKTPAVTDWQNTATTDPDRIAAWWRTAGWNIGLCTGRAGLLVVDLDVGCGDQPPPEWAGTRDGSDVLDQLAAEAGQPPPTGTYTVLTPSGGRHLYFRQPAGTQLRNTQGALGWRIDTRGHGGFVLAAGSRSPHGHYRALPHPVAELPDWIIGALTSTLEPAVEAQSADRPAVSGWRVQAYLRAVIEGERRHVVTATVGQRHRTLLRAARRLGHWVGGGVLAADTARAVLINVDRRSSCTCRRHSW